MASPRKPEPRIVVPDDPYEAWEPPRVPAELLLRKGPQERARITAEWNAAHSAPEPVRTIPANEFLSPSSPFSSGATNLSEGDIEHQLLERKFPSTGGQVPEGQRASFRDPTLGTNVLPSGDGLGAQSSLATLYEQLYDDMRTNAEDMWQRATAENDDLIAAQQSYLDTLGGPADLSFYDDQLTRALNHLNQTEEQLLAGITEMQTLVEQGIVGAAERQMQMFSELEQVRGERLRLDEERSKQQMMQIEAERVAAEQAWHGSIAEGGVQRQTEHAQRQADAAARLEGMGIDPSAMATDETAALLEMQAERGDLFSGRIEAAGTAEAGYREQELSNMFMGANRSLEDQLFAGRAATGETEAQALQALSEAVLGQQQLVAGTTAQGRYEARESSEAGKHAERGSAAQRASDAALARLGFAEGKASDAFAADASYYSALDEIDLEELLGEIGLENARLDALDAGAATQVLYDRFTTIFTGDDADENAKSATIMIEAGYPQVAMDLLNRDQQLADEEFQRDIYTMMAAPLFERIEERAGTDLLRHPSTGEPNYLMAGQFLQNEVLTGFENQQGVTWEDLKLANITGDDVMNVLGDYPELQHLPASDWPTFVSWFISDFEG
tara:strand:+ start:21 stop:1868 length:1848 start_codon:yes stop_codon:yes gene_type:complete